LKKRTLRKDHLFRTVQIVSAAGFRSRVHSLSDLIKAPVTGRVYHALAAGNKTVQEIERWATFKGIDARDRQQTINGVLYRLEKLGFVEKCSYMRPDGVRAMPCTVWRATGRTEAKPRKEDPWSLD
jgi:hypothetical protein